MCPTQNDYELENGLPHKFAILLFEFKFKIIVNYERKETFSF